MVRRLTTDISREVNLLRSIVSFHQFTRAIIGCPVAVGQDTVSVNVDAWRDKDVIDAAKSGDYLAMYTVNYCMEFLGKAIADITYVIDPERYADILSGFCKRIFSDPEPTE